MEKVKGHIDWYIFIPVMGLMLFSIAFVYSASASFAYLKFGSRDALFWNHTIRIAIAIIVLIVAAKIDYHFWIKISKPIIFIAVALLIIVLFQGQQLKGATRWINIWFIRFQPSEFAKYALVLHLSVLLSKKQENIKDFKEGMLPLLIWSGMITFLILIQPNHSTAFVILVIAISMMLVGNVNLFHLGALTSASLGVFIIYAVSARYPIERISAFLGRSDVAKNADIFNYQLQQSLIALGNGSVLGLGPGQSRQSDLFLPESYGDFIFSVIGEEYGLIGLLLIIAAFILIFWRGMLIAKKSPDKFGYFLAVGILITLSLFAFVNAGVNCGILPTTGLPMPFISYGGTAVIFHAAAIGILLNISAQAGVYPKDNY